MASALYNLHSPKNRRVLHRIVSTEVDPLRGIQIDLRLEAHSGGSSPKNVFSDVGGTVAATEGQNVRAWQDLSNLSLAVAGTGATLDGDGELGRPCVAFNGTAVFTFGPLASNTKQTIFLVYNVPVGTADFGVLVQSVDNSALGTFQVSTWFYVFSPPIVSANLPSNTWQILTVRRNGAAVEFRLNGIPITLADSTVNTNGWQLTKLTGPSGTKVSHLLIANDYIDTTAVQKVERYLRNKARIRNETAPLVVFAGDSLFFGTGTTTPATDSIPAQTAGILGAPWDLENLGINGYRWSDMADLEPGRINYGLYGPDRSLNVCVAQGSINELRQGMSAASIYARAVDFCAKRKAGGFLTVLGAPTAAFDSASDVPRQDLLALFRADFSVATADHRVWLPGPGVTYANSFADLAADPTIGSLADLANTTYFADQLHPTTAGAAIAADIYALAIDQAINPTPAPPPTGGSSTADSTTITADDTTHTVDEG